VYAIRPTQALLKRLGVRVPGAEAVEATTALGDWFVRTHNVGHQRLLLCTSSRSLLTILIPARDLPGLGDRVRIAAGELLFALGAPADQINRELEEMRHYTLRSSKDRSVIGSMTDMAYLADGYLQDGSSPEHLVVVGMKLAQAPCRPLSYESPQRVALELLRRSD
jgi:hypothetical protein